MLKRPRTRLLGLLIGVLLSATRTQALPPGFVQTPVAGGWNEVCGLAFSADGTRMYAVERGGKVWIVENGVKQATPFLDISDEVGAWRDFGMLGFALHPNFQQNGYVYALFVVDRYYLFHHGQPDYNPALLESERYQATIGRLSRFTADPASGYTTIIPGSEKILIGATPADGIPVLHESHGTGQVVFGSDGTLLVSTGDGASYDTTDTGNDPLTYFAQALTDHIIEPWENVGAWRAQQVDSLDGKILRLDPNTGYGALGNPWFDPTQPASARSRVFALGLRNPYRFTLRPDTGSHDPADGDPGTFYIGDVGWTDAESLHILKQGGQNFGWPAFEGLNQRATSTTASTYWNAGTPDPLAPNPLASQPGCSHPFLRFRDLIVQESLNPPSWPNPCNPAVEIPDQWVDPNDSTVYHYEKFVHSRPPISWRSHAWVATFDASGEAGYETMGTPQSPVSGPDFSGNASTGGVWYTGTDFPPEWQNTYFHGDYGSAWIKNFVFGANDQPLSVADFLDTGSVTFVATNPVTGGIYYVNWGSTVNEVRWVGTGNTPPTAVAEPAVSWNTGSQLTVEFTGSNSSDPDPGAVLSYLWDFGDGSAQSTQPDPSHTFTTGGTSPTTFLVTLTVTDEDNHSDVAQARVSLNNSPPSVEITSPVDGGLYNMAASTIVPVSSSISDAEQPTNSLECSLLVELVHNNHTHSNPPLAACEADIQITPEGCDGNTYHWRITLTVIDPEGLSTNDSVSLAPDCSTVPNQAPLAQPDAVPVLPAGSVVVDVLANDIDYDGTLVPSSVQIESPPSSGTASVNPATGAIVYTHGGTSPGDSFTYTAADDDGARSNAATVSIIALSTEGLVAAYGFDEAGGTEAVDSSGEGNTGSLSNVTRTTAGRVGNALVYDGTSSMVTIPDSSSLDLTTAMTLEAWVNPTEIGYWRDVIYKGANDIYYLMVSSSYQDAPATGGTFSSSPLYSTGGALPLGTWSHLAATYDGISLRLYVNGVKVRSRAQSGPIQTSTGPLTIGGDFLYGQHFAGRIDEVRIYSRALSPIEIQGDMATPVIGPPPDQPPVASDDGATLAEGASTLIDLAANDTDADDGLDFASIQIASGPAHGSVTVHADGAVTYSHDGSETTSDSFTYTIRDRAVVISNLATVSLTATPVNDAPVAADDSATVLEGGAVVIDLAANDTDAEDTLDPTSIAIVSSPAHGSVVVNGDGTVTYTHGGSATTSDSFTYTIRDAAAAVSDVATVSLTIITVAVPEVPAVDLPALGAIAAGLLSTGLASLPRRRKRS